MAVPSVRATAPRTRERMAAVPGPRAGRDAVLPVSAGARFGGGSIAVSPPRRPAARRVAPATHEQQDSGPGLAEPTGPGAGRRAYAGRPGTEQVRQGKPGGLRGPDPEEVAARNAGAQPVFRTENGQ